MNCWLTGWLHKREIKKRNELKKKPQEKAFLLLYEYTRPANQSTSWAEWCYTKSIENPQVTPRKLQDTQWYRTRNQAHTTIDSPLRMYKICSLFLSVLVLQLNLRPRTLSVSMARKTFLMLFFLYLEIGRGIVSFLFSLVLLCKWSGLQTYIF